MNSTVWKEQIDRGLKNFIENTLKLSDSEGNKKSVPVYIRKPDEDFKVENYPMVTVYHLSTSKRDAVRYYPFRVPRQYNLNTGTVKMERTAVPYTLTYQIDFWSTQQRDMNEMTRLWNFEVERDFNLPVVDSGGSNRFTFCTQQGQINKVDKLNGTDRVFCTSFTYHIWAEIDEENESALNEVALVTNVKFKVNDVLDEDI